MCALPAHVRVMANKESAMFADMQLFYAMCFSIHTGCLFIGKRYCIFHKLSSHECSKISYIFVFINVIKITLYIG
jgi:hypothetical protein